MHTDNVVWWLITLLNCIGYFIFRFGSSKNGKLSPLVEFVGGTILLVSFLIMGIAFGIKAVAILIIIFMFPITLTNEALFFKGKVFKRQNENVQKDLKMLGEIMPGITKENNNK